MEEKLNPVQWVLVLSVWALILYGLWQIGGWMLSEVMNLTPKKLAMTSLLITAIPFCFLILFGVTGITNAMHLSGALTLLSFWLSVPAMIIAAIWYLVAR